MNTVCEINECTGCMACVNVCTHKAINILDEMKNMNAVIDENVCVNCGRCIGVCPNNVAIVKREQHSWKQGWAEDESIRMRGSSGGVASSIIINFINDGGYVCSCLFEKGDFIFRCTNNVDDAKHFAGSKYVKSNPGKIYSEIKKLLIDDNKVLFIGLPCQVAALYSFIPEELQTKLYTVDLICHGTPSIKLFELYLKQNGVTLTAISDIKFRQKALMGLGIDGKALSGPGTVDRYLISFLNAVNYTNHCYKCQYATIERVADVTLGDSWGTSMVSEMQKGVSLMTTQTEKGEALLKLANLSLHDVNVEIALANNGNLQHSSIAPQSRDAFFSKLCGGANYNKLVMKYFPKQCIRQVIKGLAIKLKLLKMRK